MTRDERSGEMNRRNVLRTLGVAGLATTGVAGLGGTAAAQERAKNPINYSPNEYSVDSTTTDVEQVGSMKVSITSVNKTGQGEGTANGQVRGRVRTPDGIEKIDEPFQDVPIQVTEVGAAGFGAMQQRTLINLVLGPINLNVLGLIIQTNTIRLRVSCDPSKGLLGQLLCGLLLPSP